LQQRFVVGRNTRRVHHRLGEQLLGCHVLLRRLGKLLGAFGLIGQFFWGRLVGIVQRRQLVVRRLVGLLRR
jgi:hypothetical protein